MQNFSGYPIFARSQNFEEGKDQKVRYNPHLKLPKIFPYEKIEIVFENPLVFSKSFSKKARTY